MRAPLGCGHEAKQAAGAIEGQVGPGGHRQNHMSFREHLLETNRRKRPL